jgi:hypothetical protein
MHEVGAHDNPEAIPQHERCHDTDEKRPSFGWLESDGQRKVDVHCVTGQEHAPSLAAGTWRSDPHGRLESPASNHSHRLDDTFFAERKRAATRDRHAFHRPSRVDQRLKDLNAHARWMFDRSDAHHPPWGDGQCQAARFRARRQRPVRASLRGPGRNRPRRNERCFLPGRRPTLVRSQSGGSRCHRHCEEPPATLTTETGRRQCDDDERASPSEARRTREARVPQTGRDVLDEKGRDTLVDPPGVQEHFLFGLHHRDPAAIRATTPSPFPARRPSTDAGIGARDDAAGIERPLMVCRSSRGVWRPCSSSVRLPGRRVRARRSRRVANGPCRPARGGRRRRREARTSRSWP